MRAGTRNATEQDFSSSNIPSVLTCLVLSCNLAKRKRPDNVPSSAVFVRGPKGTGVWQHCEIKNHEVILCQIFNVRGQILYDEPFVKYVGKMPTSAADLKLSSDGGEQWIQLTDGTILVPSSRADDMIRFLDWLFGKSTHR